MTAFTRTDAEEIAARAVAACTDIWGGYQVAIKGTRYGSDSVSVTLIFTEAGVDLARQRFAAMAQFYGLTPNDYGREFLLQGEQFRVAGIATNRLKFPIDIERVRDGKKFKLTETAARAKLHGDA